MKMAHIIRDAIDADLQRNYIARWHDESHYNKFLSHTPPALILHPSYCYPQDALISLGHPNRAHYVARWGCDYQPKIIAIMKQSEDYAKVADLTSGPSAESMLSGPLISVVISSHDRPMMLAEAVQSAVSQTLKNIEIIVVLSAPSDENRKAALDLARLHGVRVVEIAKPNLAAARNAGIAAAQAEWVAFLDDDDLWLPNKLEAQLEGARRTGADLVSCDFELFNEQRRIEDTKLSPIPTGYSLAEALMLGNYVSGGSAALVKKSVLVELGGFDENLRAVEDFDMWRRIAWKHQIAILDEPYVRIRRHSGSMQKDSILMLEAVTAHFAKLLGDTPQHLRHMLPQAFNAFLTEIRSLTERSGFLTRAASTAPAAPAVQRTGLRKLVRKLKVRWRGY